MDLFYLQIYISSCMRRGALTLNQNAGYFRVSLLYPLSLYIAQIGSGLAYIQKMSNIRNISTGKT